MERPPKIEDSPERIPTAEEVASVFERITDFIHMNIFKSGTLKWWQVSMLKFSSLSFGIAVGAYWHELFFPHIALLVTFALILGVYLAFVWFR